MVQHRSGLPNVPSKVDGLQVAESTWETSSLAERCWQLGPAQWEEEASVLRVMLLDLWNSRTLPSLSSSMPVFPSLSGGAGSSGGEPEMGSQAPLPARPPTVWFETK